MILKGLGQMKLLGYNQKVCLGELKHRGTDDGEKASLHFEKEGERTNFQSMQVL